MSKTDYKGFRDLIVYQKSYKLGLEIFQLTKTFPREELYSLTDQIRKSSRSVPSNIAEAWYKRRYVKSFVAKLIDSSGEAAETEVWLDYSLDLKYIEKGKHDELVDQYEEVLKMLNSMIQNPDKFCF